MYCLVESIVTATCLAPFGDRTGRMMTNSVFCIYIYNIYIYIYTEEMTHIFVLESWHIGLRNDLLPVLGCTITWIIADTLYFYWRVPFSAKRWYNTFRPTQNVHHFADGFFKFVFLNMFLYLLPFSDNNIADDTENLCIHSLLWLLIT